LLARNDHQLKQRLQLLHYLDVLDDFMVQIISVDN